MTKLYDQLMDVARIVKIVEKENDEYANLIATFRKEKRDFIDDICREIESEYKRQYATGCVQHHESLDEAIRHVKYLYGKY